MVLGEAAVPVRMCDMLWNNGVTNQLARDKPCGAVGDAQSCLFANYLAIRIFYNMSHESLGKQPHSFLKSEE